MLNQRCGRLGKILFVFSKMLRFVSRTYPFARCAGLKGIQRLSQRRILLLNNAVCRMVSTCSASFKLVAETKANGLIDVSKYESLTTGLTVTLADVEGPVVNGHFCIATETHDDAGLPHTLEHLIFMGSKNFPYKGFLDLLANRCFASGTNAWTAEDHTCYTVTTAGQAGFLKLLPVYLDHIYFPMLTEAQYMTEVHHVNGEGEDAGTVYTEMQDYEGKQKNLTDWALNKALYPDNCGYGVESGGRIASIRKDCSNERVQKFHKELYHPKNTNLIITGRVKKDAVFSVLELFEQRLIENGRLHGVKPWATPVPELKQSVDLRVLCPCSADDESSAKGIVRVGWRGPKVEHYYDNVALQLLAQYLVDSPVSPFQKAFVQIADPFCAKVSLLLTEYAEADITLTLKGIPPEKLPLIKTKIFETLQEVAKRPSEFDKQRMTDLIQQMILHSLSSLEDYPHSAIADTAIKDFLYPLKGDYSQRFNDVAILSKLKQEPVEFWLKLLTTWLSDQRTHVFVIGEPNLDYGKKMSEEEKKRLEERKASLGAEGLLKCGALIESAIAENEANEPPDELMDEYAVSGLEGLEFFKVETTASFLNCAMDTVLGFQLADVPVALILADIKSNFVEIDVQLDTTDLSPSHRLLLSTYMGLLFESSIARDGVVVSHEQIVKELDADLLYYGSTVGVRGLFPRVLSLGLKLSIEKYPKAVQWIRNLLYGLVFDKERIRVIAQKIVNGADSAKQDGHKMCRTLLNALIYEKDSNTNAASILRQEKFLTGLVKRLDDNPNAVIEDFEILRKKIVDPSKMVIHLASSVKSVAAQHPAPSALWSKVLPESLKSIPVKATVIGGSEPVFLRPEKDWGRSCLLPLPTCESAFVIQAVPVSIKPLDADLPALMVLIQYLVQSEGPLWRQIRGRGLAYGASIYLNVFSGVLSLDIYRTPNPTQTYDEFKQQVEQTVAKDADLDEDMFEAAKSSLIFELISEESTVSQASAQSLLAYYKGVPQNYNKLLIETIPEVTEDELYAVGVKYLMPLFDQKKATLSVTCHTSKAQEVVEGFQKLGRELEVVSLDSRILIPELS